MGLNERHKCLYLKQMLVDRQKKFQTRKLPYIYISDTERQK